MSMVRFTSGDVDFAALQEANSAVTPILYTLALVVLAFVWTSLLLAIVINAYYAEVADVRSRLCRCCSARAPRACVCGAQLRQLLALLLLLVTTQRLLTGASLSASGVWDASAFCAEQRRLCPKPAAGLVASRCSSRMLLIDVASARVYCQAVPKHTSRHAPAGGHI